MFPHVPCIITPLVYFFIFTTYSTHTNTMSLNVNYICIYVFICVFAVKPTMWNLTTKNENVKRKVQKSSTASKFPWRKGQIIDLKICFSNIFIYDFSICLFCSFTSICTIYLHTSKKFQERNEIEIYEYLNV